MRHPVRLGSFCVCLLLSAALSGPNGVAPPPERVTLEGVPTVPLALAEALAPYTEYRTGSFVAWHPTRREMLIATRFGETTQLHQVKSPGGARTQLTFFRDEVNTASFPPATGDYFVFARDREGREDHQLYRFDLAPGRVTRLTGGPGRNTLGAWSNAGDRLAYTSTRRNGRAHDLYVINPLEPETDRRVLETERGHWMPIGWSADDRSLFAMEELSVVQSALWQVDLETGERLPLTHDAGGPVAYTGGQISPDGRSLYVATDRDSEFRRLARLDLETGALAVLTAHIEWDVEEFRLSADGRRLAFVINEDGFSVLRLLEVATGRERRLPGVPPGVIRGMDWHPNGVELAFAVEGARMPRDVFSVNVDIGAVERWTFSEVGGLNLETFAEPERVRWQSFDGLEISGLLYRPPSRFAGPRPVVINIHGGPEAQARPVFYGRSNYWLNELGVAVVYPNIRGSTGYGRTFLTLDDGARRGDAIRDLVGLIDWIEAHPDLDAARIMVTGASYGGYLSLMIAALHPERIRCAFVGFGITSLVSFLERTEPARQDLRRVEYGDERDPAMRAVLDRLSPLTHAERISKPLFIAQGRNDPRVPVEEAEQMAAAVRANGIPFWYMLAEDEGHGFARKSNADYLHYIWVLFMREFLLG